MGATRPWQAEALHKIGYGLHVVGPMKDGRANAQVANALIQVCAEPPAVTVCLNKLNLTHSCVAASRRFAVSIVAEDAPLKFIGLLGDSSRDVTLTSSMAWMWCGEFRASPSQRSMLLPASKLKLSASWMPGLTRCVPDRWWRLAC
jgi:hypothetical protein